MKSALPESCLTSNGREAESNDYFTISEGNKRSYSNNASNQSAKRFCEAPKTESTPQFYVFSPAVKPVCDQPLLNVIRQKYRQLCGWTRRGFPGSHSVPMHLGNYQMISQSPYMVTWKSVGKRYMMLIEDKDKVYMLDHGDNLFTIDHIQFPCDVEYTRHLKNTLVDGELVIDTVDGADKPRYLINDIITYNGQNVSAKPFRYRLRLISEWIVNVRNKAIRKGHIKKSTQPFSIRDKEFFGLSEVNKLLSPAFPGNLPHGVDGFVFLPENNAYMSGECRRLLKWKDKETIEFRLEIVDKFSTASGLREKEAHLFLNHENTSFATMPYLPTLQEYHKKVISCSYKDGQWRFHRLRDDRPSPNSKQTAMGAMDAVKRPVTRQDLCDLIQNHAHGGD